MEPTPQLVKFFKVAAKGGGKGSAVSFQLLREVSEFLGWSFTEEVGALPLSQLDQVSKRDPLEPLIKKYRATLWGYDGVKQPQMFWLDSEEEAAACREDLLRIANKVGAAPKSPGLGTLWVKEVGPVADLNENPSRPPRWGFQTQGWWYGVPAFTVFDGTSSVQVMLGLDNKSRLGDPDNLSAPKWWTWAYSKGLREQAAAILVALGDEKVTEMTRPPSAIRRLEGTGTCGVCEKNVKLSGKSIMRHGWAVRGDRSWGSYGNSWHTGPCYGTGYLPWELDSKSAKDYLQNALKPSLAKAESDLERLRSFPENLTVQTNKGPQVLSRPTGDPGIRDPYMKALSLQISETTLAITMMTADLKQIEARIRGWAAKPLPG